MAQARAGLEAEGRCRRRGNFPITRALAGIHFFRIGPPITRTSCECKSCWQSFRASGRVCAHSVCVFRNARFLIGSSDYENISQVQGILALTRWARRRPPALRANTARARGAAEAWKTARNALATKDIPEFLQPVIEWPLQRTFGERGGGRGAMPGRDRANFGRACGHRLRRIRLNG